MRASTKRKILCVLRILLTLLCLITIGYIFSNSLETGEKSAQKSNEVVQTVQKVVSYVAPQSPIVTATGDAYDRLHDAIRVLAHFSEFAVLGALLIWCYFSYTVKKKYLYIPISMMLIVPITDECIQLFSAGRGAQISDVLIDCLGCGIGGIFAVVSLGIVLWILSKQRNKKGQDVAVACYVCRKNVETEKE